MSNRLDLWRLLGDLGSNTTYGAGTSHTLPYTSFIASLHTCLNHTRHASPPFDLACASGALSHPAPPDRCLRLSSHIPPFGLCFCPSSAGSSDPPPAVLHRFMWRNHASFSRHTGNYLVPCSHTSRQLKPGVSASCPAHAPTSPSDTHPSRSMRDTFFSPAPTLMSCSTPTSSTCFLVQCGTPSFLHAGS